jgi:hypothetical protein
MLLAALLGALIPLGVLFLVFVAAPLILSRPLARFVLTTDRIVQFPIPGVNGRHSLFDVVGVAAILLAAYNGTRYRGNFGAVKDYDDVARQARYEWERAEAGTEILALILMAVLSLSISRIAQTLVEEADTNDKLARADTVVTRACAR